MELSEFLRVFEMRGKEMAWFLGAGSSASSGIPTAGQVIRDLKVKIYSSDTGINARALRVSDREALDVKLREHFVDRYSWSALTEDEYSAVFDVAYRNPEDRKRYIRSMVQQGTPSRGHYAMAGLMTSGYCPIVWTTNFDDMVERAAMRITEDPNFLLTLNLNDADDSMTILNQRRTPVQLKLHGDYQLGRLMNVSDELRNQNASMEYSLGECCQRFGLCIMGYSGRDDSVMRALNESIRSPHSFPHGIFRFARRGGKVSPPVEAFIKNAKNSGIEAEIVFVESFDELMQRLFYSVKSVKDEILRRLEPLMSWITEMELPDVGENYPLLRLNALEVTKFPMSCRLVKGEFNGGIREVRQVIQRVGSECNS